MLPDFWISLTTFGFVYFFKFSINPETADISQPKPIIINEIFHPIPLSKTKTNVYRANKLTGMAIPYNIKWNFLFFFFIHLFSPHWLLIRQLRIFLLNKLDFSKYSIFLRCRYLHENTLCYQHNYDKEKEKESSPYKDQWIYMQKSQ